MRQFGLAILLYAVLPFSVLPACAEDGPITPGEAIRLFNGKDLSNFYTWLVDDKYQDPDKVFSVVDQVDGAPAIRVSGQHWGAFITKEAYANYHLTAEFRWGLLTWGERTSKTKDSGILVHCQEPDGNTKPDFNGPWMLSVEFQIIQGGTGDFILVAGHGKDGNRIVPTLTVTASKDRDGEDVYDPNGTAREFRGGRINWFGRDPDWKDELGFRGRQDVESTDGQWTRVEVICDGDKITNIVNGKVVNVGTRSSLTQGKIIFQSEGAEIFFRRIDLQPLSK
ncbi:MAG: DUF1080 domain-containing protein [Acidobacteria bacterium]|nr:MAG: DUF1080 domain-containing protein [Acidobacteriota bacterium]PYV38454.1 MAG: DUF1080 domain-containing protein [Acidobacteriota bacterium]